MRTLLTSIILSLVSSIPACSFFRSPPPPPPPRAQFLARTATLDITAGITVLASVDLPDGFIPRPGARPMWLAQGLAIGLAGTLGGKSVVISFGGEKLNAMSVIASDFGPGAPHGHILEAAASPDGMALATAVAAGDAPRLDLMVVDSLSGGTGHTVASFDGAGRVVSLDWLDRRTIAIVLRPAPSPAIVTGTTATEPASGLYLVDVSGVGSLTHLDRIQCPLGRMSFSPNRRFAVSIGDAEAPAAIFDLHTQGCVNIAAGRPIGVLGWAPDSSAFLYVARDRAKVGVFRYTVATGQRVLIAVSSAAAAYASDGTILAIGNGRLSWAGVAKNAGAPVKAEIALLNPRTAVVTLNSLGFLTPPEMFARSSMVLSMATDSAVIDTFAPASDGLIREIIDYSYPARSAFVLASGHSQGPLALSWSPTGRALALVDADGAHAMLTVLVPPR